MRNEQNRRDKHKRISNESQCGKSYNVPESKDGIFPYGRVRIRQTQSCREAEIQAQKAPGRGISLQVCCLHGEKEWKEEWVQTCNNNNSDDAEDNNNNSYHP